jgi:hypothetical protein
MNLATPSGRIRAKLDLAYPVFGAYAQCIWSSPSVRQLYPVYLSTMHMVVRSAVPLMQAAVEQAKARGPSDPLCAALIDYYTHHMEEEAGHDGWLLEDLQAIGVAAAEVLDRIPSPRVAAMVGAQYYWLRHYHPVSLLGHITAIESYHPPVGFARRLAELTGYPKTAFRAISRHEVLDVHHHRELLELLDRLPLGVRQEKMISLSGLHTLQSGIEVLAEIRASVGPASESTN